jgi:hypothetical protein
MCPIIAERLHSKTSYLPNRCSISAGDYIGRGCLEAESRPLIQVLLGWDLDPEGVVDFITASRRDRGTSRTSTLRKPGEVIDFQREKSGTTSRQVVRSPKETVKKSGITRDVPYTGSRENRESTVHGSLQNHAADHGTLVVAGSHVPGLSRGSDHYFTTSLRFTESPAGTSTDILVQGLSTPRSIHSTVHRSVC